MDASIPPTDKLSPEMQPAPQSPTQLVELCGSEALFCDRYQLVRGLGRGGFGVTFLARDMKLPSNPLCVIKKLCPKVSNPIVLQRARQRFAREAKTLSQLGSHAQIPRLLDYFELEGEFFLVQEYVRGRTLAKEVKLRGVFSEAEVKLFLRELLPVLSYIHQQQVIHRDIKPPNLIRCQDDGRLVLIDFGAVKEQFIHVDENTHKGATTHFVGTLGFAPPEQLSLRATYASDIFAVGVTCLYLLTGKPPMEFDYDVDTGEVLWQHSVQVSDYFGKVLDKMLKTSLPDRYQSAEEVLRAIELEPYLDSLTTCMSNHPLGKLDDEEMLHRSYLSPIVRTAIAIRRWRKRKLAAERRRKNSEMIIY